MLGYCFLGALHVLMLVRFSEHVEWDTPSAWGYVAIVASFFVLGVFALLNESRLRPSAAAKRSLSSRPRAAAVAPAPPMPRVPPPP
jgi:hypothetical protein